MTYNEWLDKWREHPGNYAKFENDHPDFLNAAREQLAQPVRKGLALKPLTGLLRYDP